MQALPKPILHNEYRLEIAEAALERRPSRSSTSIEHVNATTRSHGTPAASVQGSIGRIAFLPRAIDKVRATLPGGAPGVYITTHDRPEITTMSGLFYRTLRITSNEFTAAVASADDENAVLAWLLSRVDDEQIAKWNDRLFTIRLADVRPEGYSLLRSYYPAVDTLSPETLMIDVIDRDDIETFAISAPEPDR